MAVWAARVGQRCLRVDHALETLAGGIERRLIELPRGIGLFLGCVGLGARLVVGALRDIAGLDQGVITLRIGFRHLGLCHRGIVGCLRRKHLGHVVRVEFAALGQADVRFGLPQAGLGLLLGSQRRLQSKLRVAVLQLGQHLAFGDECAGVHRSRDHSARGGRRHVR